MISPVDRFLIIPIFPVAQKSQSTLHPICDDIQTVCRPLSIMLTVSMYFSSFVLIKNLTVLSICDLFFEKTLSEFISNLSLMIFCNSKGISDISFIESHFF